jgi:HTH-type transcriptional regulator/antitoxin HigA
MKRFRIKPIRNEREHARALKEIDRLWDAKPGSPEHDLLEVLGILAEGYEEEAFVLEDPDPVEAIRFRMEQMGLDRSDLQPILGSRSRVSEVLSGRRKLSLAMIRRLHDALDIPYEALMPQSDVRAPTTLRSDRRVRRFASGAELVAKAGKTASVRPPRR